MRAVGGRLVASKGWSRRMPRPASHSSTLASSPSVSRSVVPSSSGFTDQPVLSRRRAMLASAFSALSRVIAFVLAACRHSRSSRLRSILIRSSPWRWKWQRCTPILAASRITGRRHCQPVAGLTCWHLGAAAYPARIARRQRSRCSGARSSSRLRFPTGLWPIVPARFVGLVGHDSGFVVVQCTSTRKTVTKMSCAPQDNFPMACGTHTQTPASNLSGLLSGLLGQITLTSPVAKSKN